MVYVTCRVVDGSGSPLNNVDVTIYKPGLLTGGRLDSGSTDREGAVDFRLDVGQNDKIEVHAKGAVRYEGYPQAEIRVVVR